ncbi:MAG TPA: protein translocase subunit SecD [Candidatus Aquilonibacter sp.]|nr:protein translocase subunit SecD [Candidatus Aquilonibacter sp.]
MRKTDRWKFGLVVLIVCWAFVEIYPPTSRDLIQQFASRAENKDAAFTNILQQAEARQQAATNSEFANLREAIGTNDIQSYFAFIPAQNQLHPTTYILNQLQRQAAGKIKLGLDLQGGTSFLVEMDTNYLATVGGSNQPVSASEMSGALSQAVDVLRKRVDAFGVAEPVIQPESGNRILIELPGLSEADKDEAETNISKAAYLEFRMVKDNSDEIVDERTGKILEAVPPGYEVLKHIEQQPNGPPTVEAVVVSKNAVDGLKGDIVSSAYVNRDQMGEPEVEFTLTADGAKKFAQATSENVGHRMAIVLDGELQTAPVIKSAIVGGNGVISGSYTEKEAQDLAAVLQNPLRAPLHIISSEDVDPTLGKDSIRSGIRASIAAVVLVSAFMLCYYWIAGITANVALITNIIILLGVMCSIGTTLTLPGIAGVVLTVGMAVDANVLIYERLREEIAKGKSLRGAIDAGYARAFGTIFDSHVTTLISSVILIWKGTGEIQGFGVTLTIGIAASLFTSLVVTRLIFNFLLDHNWLKSLPMLHIIRSAKINFMKIATPLFIISWLFIFVSLGYGIFDRGTKLFGVDFLGGDSATFTFQQKVDEEQVRKAVTRLGAHDVEIQYQKAVSGGQESLRVTTKDKTGAEVQAELNKDFPAAKFKMDDEERVGPTIGKEIQQSAIIASLMALFGILVYVAFRYEFSFAVGAVVAVIHDVLLAIGCYCIANGISGREFNATVVAAILTIIGFSINDKIVIFDRIREDLKLGVRGTFKEVINQALNQTLSRTIITSGTVLIATGCLYVFGGGVINDFAFTFLVGIVTGTYSSIYVASALVLWWHKGERPNIGASAVKMQNVPVAKA